MGSPRPSTLNPLPCNYYQVPKPLAPDDAKSGSLARRETPRFPRRQIAQLDRPKSHTHQALHSEPERRTESPNFAFSSFGDSYRELPSIAPELCRADALRVHRTVVEHYALSRLVDGFVSLSGDSGNIRALDLAARM